MKRAKFTTHAVFLLLIVFMAIVCFNGISYAQVPKYISFQGRLTDADDNPLTGDYDITFRIYDDAVSGDEQWSETQTLAVNKGIFSCLLGSVESLDGLDFDDSYWFSVQIDQDEEMEPRQRITAVAYAINSDKLDSLDATQFLRSDTDTTAAGSITFSGVTTDITTAVNEDLVIDPTGTGNVVVNINSASDGFKVISDTLTTYFAVSDEGTVTARAIEPQDDAVYDLGSSAKRWRNIYVDTINVDTLEGEFSVNHSLDDAYDDGSTITVDSDDLLINLAGDSDFVIQDDGTAVFTVDDAGDISMAGSLDIAGDLSAEGNFDINIDKFAVDAETGNTEIAGTLAVADQTAISYSGTDSALTITQGAAGASAEFLGGYVKIGQGGTNDNATGAGDIYVTGDLEVDGTIYGTVDVSGLSYSLDDAYDDGGTVTVDDHDLVLDLTSSSDFLVKDNGDIALAVTDAGVTATRDIAPLTDSQYNIGSSDNRYAHIYADSITADTITGAIEVDHSLDAAYNDGSAVTVDDTDVEWNLVDGTSFIVKDDGASVFTVDAAGDIDIANDLSVTGTITASSFSGTYSGTVPASQVTAGIFAAGDFTFQDGLTVDGTVGGSGFSGWDTDNTDDLTTATTFAGEASGTYDAIMLDDDALDDQYIELGDTFAGEASGTYDAIMLNDDALDDQYIELGDSFAGEASGTYDAIVLDDDALDDQYVELTDTFGGEVSGTYDAIVLDNDALDDQYIELGDSFGGDLSGVYSNLQLGTGVVGSDEIATDAVGADELSSTAIEAGDIEAADLPADGYASTYINVTGDTMTGALQLADTTPVDLVIDNTTVGTPDGGNLASDSGSIYYRGNYFDDTSDTDTEIDMSMKLDITSDTDYKLSIFDDGQATELFSIDENGNAVVAGSLTASTLVGSIVTDGTTSDSFEIDTDDSSATPTLTFGANASAAARIETQVGDLTLDPAGGDVIVDGTLQATNISGTFSGTISASQVTSGTFAAGAFIFQDDLTIEDNLTVDTDTLFVDSAGDKVGIGTTNPAYELDITGTGHFTGNVDMAAGLDVTGAIAATSFSGDGSNLTSLEAANVDVADSGSNYTGTTVEAILAEISDSHIEATDNPHSVTYAQVGAIEDAADTVKESHLDFGTGADQIAISDFPEGDNTFVDISGDTMTGSLNLPANGLLVGTDQLAAAGGYIGIGTTDPATELEVVGTITGDGLTIDGTVGGTGFSGWDTDASDDLTTATTFGGEVSGTYDAIVLDNDALDDQYVELVDTFGGEVSGTYDAIVVDNDALDDQYIELTDTFGGDLSGTYANLQLGTGVVGSDEIATDAVGADELSSTAIEAGDIEAADLPANGYASTYVNAIGDTMTGNLSLASSTGVNLILDNTTAGVPDGGNLASDSGSIYYRGNYFDDTSDTDTEIDMSMKLDITSDTNYKLSIYDDGQATELFSIDESGNAVVAGSLTADTLVGSIVTGGTTSDSFEIDTDDSSAAPTLTFGANASAAARIETQVGDLTIAPAGETTNITGALGVSGTVSLPDGEIGTDEIADDAITAEKLDVVGIDGTTGKVTAINSTNFTSLDGSNLTSLEAANVDVADSGSNYTGTTVEAILAEISDSHIEATDNPHSVTYAQVGAIEDAADTVKESHLDFGTGADQIAISDFPEGDNTFVDISGDTMTGSLNLPANGLLVGTDQLAAAGGYIGIGTTAPATELEVVGTITGDGLTIDGTVGGTGFSGWDTNASDDLTTATTFGGEVSGTYDAIVLDDDALDDQYIELVDTFAGEASGTYDAIVLDNDALDDQYIELTDTFGGDLSGTYANLQLGTGVVGSDEIATDAVGADELSSTAIEAGDIEAADLPADGYASTYINVTGDTMTGALQLADTTPVDLVIDNTTVGTPDGGNLASDSGSIYYRGNYFDDTSDTDTEVDMSMKLDITSDADYKLSIYDDGQATELLSIDESGNMVVAGTLTAASLEGPMVTNGTTSDSFEIDTDDSSAAPTLTFGANASAAARIETQVGDLTIAPAGGTTNITGDIDISGTVTASNFSGSYDGTVNASQVEAGTFDAGDFVFQDNLAVGDSLTVTNDLTIDTDTLFVDSAGDKVGIGMTNPATALEVVGTITGDGLTIDGTVGGTGFSGWDTDDTDDLTTATTFGGEVSGTYDAIVLDNDALDDQYIELGDAFAGEVSGTYDAIVLDNDALDDQYIELGDTFAGEASGTYDAIVLDNDALDDQYVELVDTFAGEVSGTYDAIVLDNDALDDQYIELVDTFAGEASGTYDAIVLDNDALDDQYIELVDTFGGEVSGTYDAIVLDDDALDDQYIELGDAFGGDLSGVYSNLQLGTDVVGADELSSTAIEAGDIEAADLPADGYASTYINVTGDTMTGALQLADTTPVDLVIDNTTVGTPDGGNLASDSGSIYYRGNYFDDTSDTDTEVDMSMKLDITSDADYKLSIYDDGQATELLSIDESGNMVVAGSITADSLIGPMVTNGTTSDSFEIDTDDSSATPTLTFGANASAAARIETQVGDLTIAPAGSDTNITGNVDISGTLTAGTISGDITGNADTVDNLHASATATANYLVALDGSANLPAGVVATASVEDDAITADKLDVVGIDGTTGKVTAINSTNFTSLDGSNLTSLEAANVDAADSGSNYTATTVEAILAEISDSHIEATDNPHSVTYAQVGAIEDAADTVKESHLDFGTGADQIAISDFPEGDNTFVDISGDTMTGSLNLPANGLLVGTDQLAAASGNIGIGITDPSYKLDVDGTGHFTGNLDAANGLDVTGDELTAAAGLTVSGGTVTFPDDSVSEADINWSDAQLALTAEYPNSTYVAPTSSSGTLSVGNDGSSYNWRNFYRWRAHPATSQTYEIYIRVTLPQDFAGWADSNAVLIDFATETTSASDADLDIEIYLESSSSADITSSNNVGSVAGTWEQISIDDSSFSDWDAAGETGVIVIKMSSKSNKYVKVGDIRLNYRR